MSAVTTVASVVEAVAKVFEALLPVLPASKQLEAVDAVKEWLDRRRRIIERAQARLDARRKAAGR